MSLFNGRYSSPRKADGSINSGGKVYFYETGTSTLKSVYQDEALTTAHTNPVILDSNGTALIFLASGSYDYKVDTSDDTALVPSSGPITADGEGRIISTAVSWTVDGVGGTSTTFATIALAMDSARTKIIMGGGGLTININDGTYLNEDIDFSHPQGRYINILGQSMSGVIIERNTSGAVVEIDNSCIGSIKSVTIKRSSADTGGLLLENNADLLELDDVTITSTNSSATGPIRVNENSTLHYKALTVSGWLNGISITDSKVFGDGSYVLTLTNADNGTGISITNRSQVRTGQLALTGVATGGSTAIAISDCSDVIVGSSFSITDFVNGFTSDDMCRVLVEGTPTWSGVTTQYTPAKNTVKDVSGGGSDDTALIIAP